MLLYITAGCTQSKSVFVEQQEYMLGTIIQVKVYGSSKKKIKESLEKAFRRVEEIEKKFSVRIPTSEITEINEQAGRSPVKVDQETIYLLERSLYFSDLSKGAFDPTIGSLVKLWGIGTESAQVPDKNILQQKLRTVNYKDLTLDISQSTAYLTQIDQQLDLGAIAKGYAADEMKRILKEEGIETAFLNLGGNVLTIGNKLDGSPWKVGVQNPLTERGEYIGIVPIQDEAIVSSGNYERFFEQNGVRYHHILDPQTGYPSENGLISTTIITKASIDADALSTSAYVMGLKDGFALIESLPNVEGIFITSEKKIFVTSGLKASFHLTNEEFSYEKR